MFSSGVSTSVTGDHFESPYIPSAPMNSPTNMPTGASAASSWFTTNVANSTNSYPNWQQEHGSSEPCINATDSGVWSPFESDDADGDGPSPTKRLFLQDGESKKTSDDMMPMVSVAPLLGQLLNSSEDASDNLTNGHSAHSVGGDGVVAKTLSAPEKTGLYASI